mgnify:CR=1 FL=1
MVSGISSADTEYWVAVVNPGKIIYEIAGVKEVVAKIALRTA